MTDNSQYDVYEKATIAFEKLSPKSGDLVLITVPRNTHPDQIQAFTALIQDAIVDALPEGCHPMVVQGGVEIQNLPKEVMARHGWYKLGDQ